MGALNTKAGECGGTQPAFQYDNAGSNATPAPRKVQRLPAYGRKVADLRAEGLAPTLALLIVDGWAPVSMEHEHAPWVLVVPDGDPPEEFDFRSAAGLFVYVVGDAEERVDAIARQVLRFEPQTIFCALTEETP